MNFKKNTHLILLMSVFFIFVIQADTCLSQITINRNQNENFKFNSKFELLYTVNSIEDSISDKSVNTGNFQMKKSPWKAVAFSAILPGAGQFYNESYWKIPIVWGIGGYFGYVYFKNNGEYNDYKEQYANSQTSENPDGDLRLKELREFYRDQRDLFLFYFGILYFANLVDAYVDAHLADFDVSENIQMSLLSKGNLINFKVKF